MQPNFTRIASVFAATALAFSPEAWAGIKSPSPAPAAPPSPPPVSQPATPEAKPDAAPKGPAAPPGPSAHTNTIQVYKTATGAAISVEMPITANYAQSLCGVLDFLDHELDDGQEVILGIQTPYTGIDAALAIHAQMQKMKHPVFVCAAGTIDPATAFLVAAGKSGKRLIASDATIIVGRPVISMTIQTHVDAMEAYVKHLKESEEKFIGLLAKCTGHTEAETRTYIATDHKMTPAEAKSWGIADEIGPAAQQAKPETPSGPVPEQEKPEDEGAPSPTPSSAPFPALRPT